MKLKSSYVGGASLLCATALLWSLLGLGCNVMEEKTALQPEQSNAMAAATAAAVTVSFQKGVLPVSTYSGATDASISQASSTVNNGTGATCTASGASSSDQSALLKMDVSQIPAGSIVQSAKLKLFITNNSGVNYQVYSLKQSWTETAVTWKNRTSASLWQTAGAMGANDRGTSSWGNVAGTALGAYTLTFGATGVSGIQAWISGTSANNGFIVANATNTDILAFSSKEAATAANRPLLSVTYLPPVLKKITANPGGLQPGRLLSQDLTVKLTNSNGAVVANAPVTWDVSANGGWVFPISPVTDAQGLASAKWIAGSAASQSINAKVGSGTSAVTATFTASAAPVASNANSVHFWFYPSASSSAYTMTMTPKTAVNDVYYAAAAWDGGYTGLQQLFDGSRKAIFSIWNIPAGNATLIDASSSVCGTFTGEGVGVRCLLDYPWQPSKAYRFEMTTAAGGTGRDYTVNVTDVATGAKKKIATIRYASPVLLDYYYSFAEDFGPQASNCLTTSARTVQFTPPSALVNGVWQTIKETDFDHYYALDSLCANVTGTVAGGVFTLGTGGNQVGNPLAATHLIVP